jgi:hypothetical protein
MIYLVSMLVVTALLSGAVAVIGVTLRDNAEAIVAALAGRSIRAEGLALPAPRVRVTIRTPSRRPLALQPLRAAA